MSADVKLHATLARQLRLGLEAAVVASMGALVALGPLLLVEQLVSAGKSLDRLHALASAHVLVYSSLDPLSACMGESTRLVRPAIVRWVMVLATWWLGTLLCVLAASGPLGGMTLLMHMATITLPVVVFALVTRWGRSRMVRRLCRAATVPLANWLTLAVAMLYVAVVLRVEKGAQEVLIMGVLFPGLQAVLMRLSGRQIGRARHAENRIGGARRISALQSSTGSHGSAYTVDTAVSSPESSGKAAVAPCTSSSSSSASEHASEQPEEEQPGEAQSVLPTPQPQPPSTLPHKQPQRSLTASFKHMRTMNSSAKSGSKSASSKSSRGKSASAKSRSTSASFGIWSPTASSPTGMSPPLPPAFAPGGQAPSTARTSTAQAAVSIGVGVGVGVGGGGGGSFFMPAIFAIEQLFTTCSFLTMLRVDAASAFYPALLLIFGCSILELYTFAKARHILNLMHMRRSGGVAALASPSTRGSSRRSSRRASLRSFKVSQSNSEVAAFVVFRQQGEKAGLVLATAIVAAAPVLMADSAIPVTDPVLLWWRAVVGMLVEICADSIKDRICLRFKIRVDKVALRWGSRFWSIVFFVAAGTGTVFVCLMGLELRVIL